MQRLKHLLIQPASIFPCQFLSPASYMGRVKLAGRHVLVTGGSTGIGLAVAKACLLQNATITLVARTQSKLEAAQRELLDLADRKQITAKIYIQTADVTSEEQVWCALYPSPALTMQHACDLTVFL